MKPGDPIYYWNSAMKQWLLGTIHRQDEDDDKWFIVRSCQSLGTVPKLRRQLRTPEEHAAHLLTQ